MNIKKLRTNKEKVEIYNSTIKERFLQLYNNINTQNEYRAIFSRIVKFEKFNNKDVSMFNYNELKDLLMGVKCSSTKSLDHIKSIISMYFKWSQKEGYISSYVDLTKLIVRRDVRENVSKVKIEEQYLKDEEELYMIAEDFCVNKQDAVLFVLCYEGVRGDNLEEISNLKVSDCDFENNTLLLRGSVKEKDVNGNIIKETPYTRLIENINERSMKIIKEATEETIYYKKNGMVDTACTAPCYKIYPTEYVLRYTGDRKNKISEKLDSQNITKRIGKIAKLYDRPALQATTIFKSGLINHIKKTQEEKGGLTTTDYKKANEKFGLNTGQYWDTKDLYELINS
jgi:integrase